MFLISPAFNDTLMKLITITASEIIHINFAAPLFWRRRENYTVMALMLPLIMGKRISSLEPRNLGENEELRKGWAFIFLSVYFVCILSWNKNELLQSLSDKAAGTNI